MNFAQLGLWCSYQQARCTEEWYNAQVQSSKQKTEFDSFAESTRQYIEDCEPEQRPRLLDIFATYRPHISTAVTSDGLLYIIALTLVVIVAGDIVAFDFVPAYASLGGNPNENGMLSMLKQNSKLLFYAYVFCSISVAIVYWRIKNTVKKCEFFKTQIAQITSDDSDQIDHSLIHSLIDVSILNTLQARQRNNKNLLRVHMAITYLYAASVVLVLYSIIFSMALI